MGSSSAGLAGGHSHGCIQLARGWASADEAGLYGILYFSSQAWNCSLSMWPPHLGSPCGLSSREAIVFIGQLRALRSKSKTHALRFRPRTGTVSPSSCSVEKKSQTQPRFKGRGHQNITDTRRHSSLGQPVTQTTMPHNRAI